jgi:hypothetical protein
LKVDKPTTSRIVRVQPNTRKTSNTVNMKPAADADADNPGAAILSMKTNLPATRAATQTGLDSLFTLQIRIGF